MSYLRYMLPALFLAWSATIYEGDTPKFSDKPNFITQGGWGIPGDYEEHDPPKLYNLYHDPSERFNRADQNLEIIEEIEKAVGAHRASIEKDQQSRISLSE